MKLCFHLFKYNFLFNRIRFVVLTGIALFILTASLYLNDDAVSAGNDMLQYAGYVIFIILTGKLNFRSNVMLDLKHLLSLPLSKREVVLHKSIADIAHFIPVSFVCVYGFSMSYPDYHTTAFAIILHIVLAVANIVALNKRIDFARMQHAGANFKNSILHLNKYFDVFIQIGALTIMLTFLFTFFGKHILYLEYALFLFATIMLFFMQVNATKMLSDETLSYFIFKRDFKRIGIKFALLAIPFLSFHVFKKELKEMETANEGRSRSLASFEQQIKKYTSKFSEQGLFLKIAQNDKEAISDYKEKYSELPWETEILGGYLPHIAADAGNVKALEDLTLLRPESVNMQGKIKKRTPLFSAVRKCQLATTEFLLQNGATIDHQDINGDTAIIFAAKNKCYGAVVLLNEYGADTLLKNQEAYAVDRYLKKSGINYLLKRKKRIPANTKD